MFKLHQDHIEYVNHSKAQYQKQLKRFKRAFFILNLIILATALFSSVLTSLMISKLVYSSYPTWFFFATAGASALASLVSSFLNFWLVRDSIKRIEKKISIIDQETFLYENKVSEAYKGKNRDFNFYLAIGKINDSKAAKEELSND